MAKRNYLLPDLGISQGEEWVGMPEYIQEDRQPYRTIIVHLEDEVDLKDFADLVGQKIYPATKSIYYPKAVIETYMDKVFTGENNEFTTPKYPIYIVSKGRWKSRLTSKALENMNVDYKIVVEKSEYQRYSKVIDKKKILILPQSFLDEYNTCDDLGDSKSKGPGAARNFCWEHSIDDGFRRHWVMDDNIDLFCRLNRNLKVPVGSSIIFRCMEDFVDRYRNIAMAGPQYFMFVSRKSKMPPYIMNTRIYSCNLIKNNIPYRWRGRYNEDTDLSLRMLKDKWCTILFNAFLQRKQVTQSIKGGNTKEFYSKEGTINKTLMLQRLHPNLTEVVWRFNRWHHQICYRYFKKNRLIKKKSFKDIQGINNYGMVLVKRSKK